MILYLCSDETQLGVTWKHSVVSSYTAGHPGNIQTLGTLARATVDCSAPLDRMVGQFGDIQECRCLR